MNMRVYVVTLSPQDLTSYRLGQQSYFCIHLVYSIICVAKPHKFLNDKCLTCIKPY